MRSVKHNIGTISILAWASRTWRRGVSSWHNALLVAPRNPSLLFITYSCNWSLNVGGIPFVESNSSLRMSGSLFSFHCLCFQIFYSRIQLFRPRARAERSSTRRPEPVSRSKHRSESAWSEKRPKLGKLHKWSLISDSYYYDDISSWPTVSSPSSLPAYT